jgi:hypothetical protein
MYSLYNFNVFSLCLWALDNYIYITTICLYYSYDLQPDEIEKLMALMANRLCET